MFVDGAAVAEPSVSLCSTVETLSFHGALLLSLPERAGPRGGEQVTVMLSEGHEDTETVTERDGGGTHSSPTSRCEAEDQDFLTVTDPLLRTHHLRRSVFRHLSPHKPLIRAV